MSNAKTSIRRINAVGKCDICGSFTAPIVGRDSELINAHDFEQPGHGGICVGCLVCVVMADAILNHPQFGMCRPK